MLPSDDLIKFATEATGEWSKKNSTELAEILTAEGITLVEFFQYIEKNPLSKQSPLDKQTKKGSADTGAPDPDPMMETIMKLIIDSALYTSFRKFSDAVAKSSWIRKRSGELMAEVEQ